MLQYCFGSVPAAKLASKTLGELGVANNPLSAQIFTLTILAGAAKFVAVVLLRAWAIKLAQIGAAIVPPVDPTDLLGSS